MNVPEYNKTEEFRRVSETAGYCENNVSEEFYAFKTKRIDELSNAGSSAVTKKKKKNNKHKGLFVSALAAVGSAAIITVAVVSSLLAVTVRSRNVGYDFIEYALSISNGDDQTLFARLSSRGETIVMTELTSESVRFNELQLNMDYLFEVVDNEGKIHYKEDIKTRSPIGFYTKDDFPDLLFFSTDLTAFKGSGIYYPSLIDFNGTAYELPVSTGWESEAAIDLTGYLSGEYILAFTDNGSEYGYEIYSEIIYLDGKLPAKLRFTEQNDKIYIDINEKLSKQYDKISFALINSDGVSSIIAQDTIDLTLLAAGSYTVLVLGVKNSVENEIYRETIYLPVM